MTSQLPRQLPILRRMPGSDPAAFMTLLDDIQTIALLEPPALEALSRYVHHLAHRLRIGLRRSSATEIDRAG